MGDVVAEQRDLLRCGGRHAGNHGQPGVGQHVPRQPGHRDMPDLHECRVALVPGHRGEQRAEVPRLTDTAAGGLLLLAVLIHEHHRQRRHDRHDDGPRVVLGQVVVGEGHFYGDRGDPAGLRVGDEPMPKRHLQCLAGLEIDGSRGGLDAVHEQRHADAGPGRGALVPHHGGERGLRPGVGDAIVDAERFHPRVVAVGRCHGDDLELRLGGQLGGRLGCGGRFAVAAGPVDHLLVAKEHHPLLGHVGHGGRRPGRQGLGSGAGAHPVHDRHRGHGFEGVFLRAVGVECRAGRRATQRDDRDPAAGRQLLDELRGPGPGVVEQHCSAEPLPAHAHAVVEHEDRVHRPRRCGGAPGGQERPGHGEPEQRHRRHSQGHEQQVAEPEEGLAPPRGLEQKLHRRPVHLAEDATVQQMNEHRPGRGRKAGNGEQLPTRQERDHGCIPCRGRSQRPPRTPTFASWRMGR